MKPMRLIENAMRRHWQRGQSLVYGLFMMVAGLAVLIFIFNTGQITEEKTKLVNTADAVAYSAAVMHARALNFDAYTNRALMANEVLIAQAVSAASWSAHVVRHTDNVPPMNCNGGYSVPASLLLFEYIPVCYLLSLPAAKAGATGLEESVKAAAKATVAASELAKTILQGAQASMAAALIPARQMLMQQVADANYAGDGAVHVDPLPLTDTFSSFNGSPFIRQYGGADRARLKAAVVTAAHRDDFVRQRSWTSANNVPCILANKAAFRRRGGTELVDYDEWKAMDTASLHRWEWHTHGILRPPHLRR
ncbi:pilus assembly protein TadG-related protein [Oxalobacteraceae bacterium A2-2]